MVRNKSDKDRARERESESERERESTGAWGAALPPSPSTHHDQELIQVQAVAHSGDENLGCSLCSKLVGVLPDTQL
eukprot:2371365-Rhodomonas_salina.1